MATGLFARNELDFAAIAARGIALDGEDVARLSDGADAQRGARRRAAAGVGGGGRARCEGSTRVTLRPSY